MKQVVVVGAGVSGLTLAYRLQELAPALHITILEEESRPGGNAWTERPQGFSIEVGPNGFLDSKPSTIQLCRDLGLQEHLVQASPASSRNRYLFLDGKLRRLPAGPLDFLRSDVISWRGKFNLLTEPLRGRSNKCDESIDAFARRRAGAEFAEVFADALVTGIHGGDPKLLSVRAAFPRLAGFERDHGSIISGMKQAASQRRAEAAARGETYQRGGKLWSCHGGMRQLIEAMQANLRRPITFGVRANRIERNDAGASKWHVIGDGSERWQADAVILACPAYRQAGMLAGLDPGLADQVSRIAYNRIAVVALGYLEKDIPMAVDGFGYIAPQRTRRDLLGVQWCSSVYPDRAPSGYVLMRALCGGWHRADVVGWDDGRLLQAVREELRLAMSIKAPPAFHHIVRWDRAIPQYHLGHLDRVQNIMTRASRYPGLFLAGNAYHGVALNDCTEQGAIVAQQVARFLAPGQYTAQGPE